MNRRQAIGACVEAMLGGGSAFLESPRVHRLAMAGFLVPLGDKRRWRSPAYGPDGGILVPEDIASKLVRRFAVVQSKRIDAEMGL